MGFVSDLFGGGGGDSAADASIRASEIQADAQREALDYLREREAVPQQYREQALGQLGGFYQLPQDVSQEQLLQQAQASPLYDALLSTRGAGEEGIARYAAATGGLRSGNTIEDLATFNQQLEQNALLQAFNQQQQRADISRQENLSGLASLANLPSYAPQIAQGIGGIGQTLAQGQIAAAQAQQQGQQQGFGNLLGAAQTGIQAYNAFSDKRLKRNIKQVGTENGHKIYEWKWKDKAKELFGLSGSGRGVIAQEVAEINPDAVVEYEGYLTVNYPAIGVSYAV